MADGVPDVEIIERVEVVPTTDDETIDAGETVPEEGNEGTAEDTEEVSPDGKPEALVKPKPTTEVAPAEEEDATTTEDGLVDLPGETPRERALRKVVDELRGAARKERTAEILPTTPPLPARRELTEAEKEVLGKYKPEELTALREVLPALAKEMGFVKAEELEGATYQDKSQVELDGFLDKHPEYLPDKDKDGVLWEALKSEFQMYRAPQNPKDYRKILERAHQTVFGIKPSGSLPNNQAAERKIQVASHGGAAGPGSTGAGGGRTSANSAAQEYRFDMLKGFSDEEKSALMEKAGT